MSEARKEMSLAVLIILILDVTLMLGLISMPSIIKRFYSLYADINVALPGMTVSLLDHGTKINTVLGIITLSWIMREWFGKKRVSLKAGVIIFIMLQLWYVFIFLGVFKPILCLPWSV